MQRKTFRHDGADLGAPLLSTRCRASGPADQFS